MRTLVRSERTRLPLTRLIGYAFVIGALKWVGRNRASKDGWSPAQRSGREPPKSRLQKLASVASTLKREVSEDNLSIAAAGVAFYAFLSIFPGLAAAVSIYGLVSDPADIERQVAGLSASWPEVAAIDTVKPGLGRGPRLRLTTGDGRRGDVPLDQVTVFPATLDSTVRAFSAGRHGVDLSALES